MAIKLGQSSETEGIHEINITPFVDIVLVLLIIFMISTPAMVYRGLQVQLPQAKHSQDIARVTLNITIQKDGSLQLDKRVLTLEEFKGVYKKIQESKAMSDAIVSADKEVIHGKVVEVVDYLKSIGIEQVGLATSNPKKSGAVKP